jgi:hypothetical protein
LLPSSDNGDWLSSLEETTALAEIDAILYTEVNVLDPVVDSGF